VEFSKKNPGLSRSRNPDYLSRNDVLVADNKARSYTKCEKYKEKMAITYNIQ